MVESFSFLSYLQLLGCTYRLECKKICPEVLLSKSLAKIGIVLQLKSCSKSSSSIWVPVEVTILGLLHSKRATPSWENLSFGHAILYLQLLLLIL